LQTGYKILLPNNFLLSKAKGKPISTKTVIVNTRLLEIIIRLKMSITPVGTNVSYKTTNESMGRVLGRKMLHER
jgi:hypothetical protein